MTTAFGGEVTLMAAGSGGGSLLGSVAVPSEGVTALTFALTVAASTRWGLRWR